MTIHNVFSGADLKSQSLAHATALPAFFYTDISMRAQDRAAVFEHCWQLVAHESQLANIGDYLSVSIAEIPLVVIRDTENQIRAYHNVCRHRAGPLVTCDGSNAKVLRCHYHGWTYGLDGILKSAPEMHTAPDFEPSAIRLPPMQVREWQGLIYVGTDNAPSFEDFVAGMSERVAGLSPKNYRFHHKVTYDIDCNWKVYVDNYLEGYHVPHIHPGLNALLDYRSYITEAHQWYSYQYSPLESGDELYGDGDALYYFQYPNTMLNLLPGRLQTNRVLPIGVNRCRVEFAYFYPHDDRPEAAIRREKDLAFSDEVQKEDVDMCESVQRGLASGGYLPGRLNPLRENAVHHFHEVLRAAYRARAKLQGDGA